MILEVTVEGNERRKAKRIDLQAKIIVNRLDGKDKHEIDVEITDVSTSGIGFICKEFLAKGSIYDADLTLWNKDVIHCFIEIVRIMKKDDGVHYGGLFIGMPENDAKRIEVYDMVETYSKDN